MLLSDTILALSSPPNTGRGDGTRAILRIAGPAALESARIAIPTLPSTAGYHGNLVLPLLHPTLKIASALLFRAPRSFSGDDLVELHLPNSPALLRAVTEKILANSTTTRLATPGEFSARAFFNRKIDLTQAEGIAATISATSENELRAAANLREGHLHKEMQNLTEELASVLALIEAGIDFSDEEGVSFITADSVASTLQKLQTYLDNLLANSLRVDRLDAPPTIVFIGKPNVGKSSLINALAGHQRSIVSPIAGTTRDSLAAVMHTHAGDIRLLDVPGEEAPTDDLRQKMMHARHLALLEADLILQVIDNPTDAPTEDDLPAPTLTIQNKSDLAPAAPNSPHLQVSAKTTQNLEALRSLLITRLLHKDTLAQGRLVLNHRHRLLLHEARSLLHRALPLAADPTTFTRHPELLAADLRRALDTLGQITGSISPDDLLGRIFSQFCIGK